MQRSHAHPYFYNKYKIKPSRSSRIFLYEKGDYRGIIKLCANIASQMYHVPRSEVRYINISASNLLNGDITIEYDAAFIWDVVNNGTDIT